jgi:GNAT superfamily N-acetyltransferase
MKVRPANPADGPAVLALASEFATSFAVEPRSVQRTFVGVLATDNARLLVIEDDQVVGYLLGFLHDTFYANGPVGWVEELMVNSTYRRRGGGRMLMGEFESWVSGRGGRIVALATRRASEFYQAVGYEESATYLRKVLLRK